MVSVSMIFSFENLAQRACFCPSIVCPLSCWRECPKKATCALGLWPKTKRRSSELPFTVAILDQAHYAVNSLLLERQSIIRDNKPFCVFNENNFKKDNSPLPCTLENTLYVPLLYSYEFHNFVTGNIPTLENYNRLYFNVLYRSNTLR